LTERRYTIKNKVGLHARPSSLFVRKAGTFESEITISSGDASADGKSILSLLALGAGCGAEIVLRAEGPDEEKAISSLIAVLDSFED
jgi:phosphocarrier protein HPr